jgi:hypothetical protein
MIHALEIIAIVVLAAVVAYLVRLGWRELGEIEKLNH